MTERAKWSKKMSEIATLSERVREKKK